MIFWVLTVAIVALWIFLVVQSFLWEGGWMGITVLIFGGLIAGLLWFLFICGGVAVGLNHLIGPNRVVSETTALKALGSDSATSGRVFIGGGYIDGERVLSYIRVNDDGSFTPDQVEGSKSRVHELDDSAPVMVTHSHVADRWWLSPSVPLHDTYEFTIPTGSVDEGYSVTP